MYIYTVSRYIGVNDYTKRWIDANEYCIDTYGTSLATLTSYDDILDAVWAGKEAGFFDENADSSPYGDRFFVGLNDIDENGIWSYIEENSNSNYTFNPNFSGGEYCSEIIWQSEYKVTNDIGCSDAIRTRYFVCNSNSNINSNNTEATLEPSM